MILSYQITTRDTIGFSPAAVANVSNNHSTYEALT